MRIKTIYSLQTRKAMACAVYETAPTSLNENFNLPYGSHVKKHDTRLLIGRIAFLTCGKSDTRHLIGLHRFANENLLCGFLVCKSQYVYNTDIINRSFAEGRLPPSWKSADTVPIPKQKPIRDINKHLRPTSLTPVLSKVAEEFIVAEHLRPAILKKIGENQFGAIPESSTTHALISMVHSWSKHTDGTGSSVRVVLFDYGKAFDLIDHALLARKLLALDMLVGVSSWIIDFLSDHMQRVKLGGDCLSEWRNVPAGVPQGTRLGPWLFILMIDDINTSNTELWKYVDGTTIGECVDKGEDYGFRSLNQSQTLLPLSSTGKQ